MGLEQRKLVEEFIAKYQQEVEEYRASIEDMEQGRLGLWAVVDGVRMDRTADTIARDKEVVANLVALVGRYKTRLLAGDFDH